MILEVLGSAGFGSLIGGVFGWLGKKQETENIQMKLNHELDMVTAKTDATIAIANINMEQAKQAGQLLVEQIDAKAFHESQKPTSKFAEAIKSLVRPIITFAMMYQTYLIYSSLDSLTGGLESLSSEDKAMLFKVLILSITGLTSTVVSWWFASRGSKQFDKIMDRWTN